MANPKLKNFSNRKVQTPPECIDWKAAKRVETFVSSLKMAVGEYVGQPFPLQEFQKHDIIYPIFGAMRPDGNRLYTRALVFVPAKNGKTTLCSSFALYGLTADHEFGAQIYSAASDSKQAGLIFRNMVDLIHANPELDSLLGINESKQRIVYPATNSFYQVLCADSFRNEGLDAHMIIFDELHTQRTRALYDVLNSRIGARRQPLIFLISTAGDDEAGICREILEHTGKIIDGTVTDDKSIYAVHYQAGEDDDWTDEKTWFKVNPGLGPIKKIDRMREEFAQAKYIPAQESRFRRYHLNQFVAGEGKLLDMIGWESGLKPIKERSLEGLECWGGLDLGEKVDMAAFVLNFPEGEGHRWLPFFFYPEGAVKKNPRKNQILFTEWASRGLITLTPGDVMDFDFILEAISELGKRYAIQEIGYDPWKATKLVNDLDKRGFRCVEVRQGHQSLGDSTSELIRLVIGGKLFHDGSPIMRWMADNVVGRYDPNNNVIPDRKKSPDKIDGIMAGIMALNCAIAGRKGEGSMYDNKEWYANNG